ncbi:MAG: hypothetical protein AB1467_06645 [Candidatus Diapherotrites archaeon]
MNGYYWKNKETGQWFFRKTKDAEDWEGPFNTRKAAKQARAEYYERLAESRPTLMIRIIGGM